MMKILSKKKVVETYDPKRYQTKFKDVSGKTIHIGDVIHVFYRDRLYKAIVTRVSFVSVFFRIIKGLAEQYDWGYWTQGNNNQWQFNARTENMVGVEKRIMAPQKRITVL